ncbi:Panacea domain-containing protein [Kocuria marina]|uniref:Panacea domain-containing protein n=1 Tax=Kocuria marina TaxID=223184 RepID=UPI0034610767
MGATLSCDDRRFVSEKANDLTAYILDYFDGPIGTLKLQKLLYYCQAWHLATDGTPLIPDRVEAWKHGPVFPGIYYKHAYETALSSWDQGDPSGITGLDRKIVDSVLEVYGTKSGWALRDLTHSEDPWKNAWEKSQEGRVRNVVIDTDEIRNYFTRS